MILLLLALAQTPDELVAQNCRICHTQSLLDQQRLGAAGWTKTVEKMAGWGAQIEKADQPAVAQLLLTRTPTVSVVFVPEKIDVSKAAALFAPLPDGKLAKGDAARGAASFAEKCAPCHGANARGDKLGPSLSGRLLLQRAPDFARAVRTSSGRMPAFELSDADVADLLAHL